MELVSATSYFAMEHQTTDCMPFVFYVSYATTSPQLSFKTHFPKKKVILNRTVLDCLASCIAPSPVLIVEAKSGSSSLLVHLLLLRTCSTNNFYTKRNYGRNPSPYLPTSTHHLEIGRSWPKAVFFLTKTLLYASLPSPPSFSCP